MNRIVLIGNGFDLAHGLKTRYEDFIDWYWDYRVRGFVGNLTDTSKDILCSFNDLTGQVWNVNAFNGLKVGKISGSDVVKYIIERKDIFDTRFSIFFESICKSIDNKGWVDIENEYYHLLKKYAIELPSDVNTKELNKQLQYLQNLLIKYLGFIDEQKVSIIESIKSKLYAPIKLDDISVSGKNIVKECVDLWIKQDVALVKEKMRRYGYKEEDNIDSINYFRDKYKEGKILYSDVPRTYMLPDAVMLLNFNYTHTAQLYHESDLGFINYIHGKIDNPQSVIFGYGDELDDDYKKLQKLNDNECLTHIKTIKYQESDNYRKLLAFAESAPYQVCIMGHSCGNSDRTLLNTLFEHKNCISIKPYYYIKDDGTDNYLELIQNISRNFTDMILMRDRVVNKTYCETLTD